MVKRIQAVCCIAFNDFKAELEFSIFHRYNILQQRMYTENCVCINLKGNTLDRKQWVNVRRVFLSIYLSLI